MKEFEENEVKRLDRLDRIVTIRMTEEDYATILSISENNRSNVSRIIRATLAFVLKMVKENNIKS